MTISVQIIITSNRVLKERGKTTIIFLGLMGHIGV